MKPSSFPKALEYALRSEAILGAVASGEWDMAVAHCCAVCPGEPLRAILEQAGRPSDADSARRVFSAFCAEAKAKRVSKFNR